jgi:hypothetical protein
MVTAQGVLLIEVIGQSQSVGSLKEATPPCYCQHDGGLQ